MAKAAGAFDADELLALALHDLEKERLEGALEKLKVAESKSGCPPLVYAELGRLYSKLKLFDRAKPMYQRYLQLQPAAVTELFQLGMAHFESGEAAEALDKWAEVLKLVPSYPPALFFTSFQYAKQGDLIEAHECCERALATVADDNLYYGRAKELMQRIDADPAYIQARQNGSSARKAH
jgi:tetratricopeptide (TPR) repeat protein